MNMYNIYINWHNIWAAFMFLLNPFVYFIVNFSDAGLDEDELQNFESSNNKLQEFRRADNPAQENSGVRGASAHCALALSVAWALRSLV